ncbi:DUF3581 domain-containing protein [SAR92 clade bacterium H455]|uniref:DUF3581 domain-containing protein n=1 Tax=SAR92 clade bacterium H455 TaxID=2974818 RepID=A0ABY5TQ88_9GAMM|nr:DUF3581 domain-containing protein [SAR92 clade bacterium H455]
MFLQQFYTRNELSLSISVDQGSGFAKTISNDFNPIHDIDSKRFCVPGDLLFALVLERYGLSQQMRFEFSGMVSADTPLVFPESAADQFEIADAREKTYLKVSRSGDQLQDQQVLESLIKNYVFFSGQNFPHILVPLMAEKNVMINPQRPLVIYESMSLQLETLELEQPSVELAGTSLEVDGKRGNAEFKFNLVDGGKIVGAGVKTLILSGLREYQQEAIDLMVATYLDNQARHSEA